MRAKALLPIFLGALLIAAAQQTPPPPAAAQKKTAPAAKQNTAQPASKKTFSFSTNVQLVVVDVFVKDKDGNPVPNLKAADFTVAEDGKAQEVKVCEFQELKNEPLASEAAPALVERPKEEAKKEETKPAVPEKVTAVTTTQIAPAQPGEIKYKDKRLMVLFFDMTSMPIQDQIRAQDAALKFLKTQITASDLVAVMDFAGGDIKVVEDFTSDRDRLGKDIKSLTVGEGQGFGITDSSDAAADTGAAFSADDSEFNIFNTDRQLAALETAVTMLGSLPEKKALIYFNSGITRNGTDNQAQMTATVNASLKNNVSIYPIDARGLVASAPLGDATKGSPGG